MSFIRIRRSPISPIVPVACSSSPQPGHECANAAVAPAISTHSQGTGGVEAIDDKIDTRYGMVAMRHAALEDTGIGIGSTSCLVKDI